MSDIRFDHLHSRPTRDGIAGGAMRSGAEKSARQSNVDRRIANSGPPGGTERRVRPGGRGLHLEAIAESFTRQTYEAGLDFGQDHAELITTFIAALATKPFVVFSGLSGSGKTRLATALGQWFGREHLLVQPVRPDWTSPEAVLGFENVHSEPSGAKYAWSVPRLLEFVLTAARDPDEPYLLVLDEMNLAHVEQYFADVLSGMESGTPIVPNLRHDGSAWRIPGKDCQYIPWPRNLLLIGTVNIDETTYTFSPKVLDRSTNIEFRVQPGSLRTEYRKESAISRGEPDLLRSLLHRVSGDESEWTGRSHLALSLQHLHRLLYDFDAEFGHRVYRESLRFGCMLSEAGLDDHKVALDFILLYKVLPKFEATGLHEAELMHALGGFATYGPSRNAPVDPLSPVQTTPVLPRSFSKLRRMARSFK